MYLVDDRFYKKSLEANIPQNQNINTNSVHSKSYVYLPPHINDEIDIDPPTRWRTLVKGLTKSHLKLPLTSPVLG